MTTALEIVKDSLSKLGVYAPSEPLSDSDAQRGLTVLQDLVSAWADEFLFLYQLVPTVLPLVIGQASYTLGLGGALNQPRPPRIAYGPSMAEVSITLATLGATTSAPLDYDIIQFGSVPGSVVPGSSMVDLTNPGAIRPGTTVYNVSGAAVTMTRGAAGLGIQVGDQIEFGQPPAAVDVVSRIEWSMRSLGGASNGTPNTVYYQEGFPLGTLYVLPTPDAIGNLLFKSWGPFTNFISLDDPDVEFSQGVDEALKNNLAVVLKSDFADTPIPQAVVVKAATCKDYLRQTNITSRSMIKRYTSQASPMRPQ